MPKKIAASFVLIMLLYFALFSLSVLGDSAGYPTLLNPPISVTVSVSKTAVNPGDVITLDYYITNESEKALYICNAGFLTYDEIYEEKGWELIEFNGAAVDPGKMIKISGEYKIKPSNFLLYDGSIRFYMRPCIEYCYYTEKVKQGEIPRWSGRFEYNASSSITLPTAPPYDFGSMLEIDYSVRKTDDSSIYDFDITLKNLSDKTISDFYISSSLGRLTPKDEEIPKSIKPNETLEFEMIFNNNEEYRPNFGKTQVVLYVSSFDNYDYDISDNIEIINFPEQELTLEAEILCDVRQAYYNEEIPYTLVLHNPTNKTYENIESYAFDTPINISPGETKYIEITAKEWMDGYGLSIFEGLNYKMQLNPYLSLDYNGYSYNRYDWCINYYDIDFPEVEIIMPPQTQDLIGKIETGNSNEYIIYYSNNYGENIEISLIGCVENGYINNYSQQVLWPGETSWFPFMPGEYSSVSHDDGKTYLELIIVGIGEETGKLYWLHDTFPVVSVVSTPRPTQKQTPTPTKTPTPTPKEEHTAKPTATPVSVPEAMIELLSGVGRNGKTVNILLTISNITEKDITDVKISDQNGNVLYELEKIASSQIYENEINIKNENEIYLIVKYTQNKTTHTVKTGSIIKLTTENNEIEREPIILPIIAFAIFTALTVIVILFIRKKSKKNKDE